MEITEYDIEAAIQALRQCATKHESENVCTGEGVTKDICRDVATYLENNTRQVKKLERTSSFQEKNFLHNSQLYIYLIYSFI